MTRLALTLRGGVVTTLVAAAVLVAGPIAPAGAAGRETNAVPAGLCNGGKAPALSPSVPADAITNQAALNCFAWQEFIALNWQADPSTCTADDSAPASSFGEPSNAPVVWETFKTPYAVFLPKAARPSAWCQPQPTGSGTTTGASARTRGLSAINKFSIGRDADLSSITETNPSDSWLTAQSGLLTLYERFLNEDEFNYIYTNELYDANKQTQLARTKGIQLPDGGPDSSSYGDVGAIELKAAWLELDDPKDWPRYKTTRARVKYPGEDIKTVTVGLVGLHIIHKTQSAQQFVWATFEHVDNAPSSDEAPKPGRKPPFTYFDPACDPDTDHYKCKPNAVPVKACTSTSPPTPAGCDPYDAPVQVVRTTPRDDSPTNPIVQLNDAVRAMIASTNRDSVFQHYELVNVLWPDDSTEIEPGARVPLTCGDATPPPSQEIVANTTLETYVQGGTTGEPDPQPDPCNAGSADYTGDTCLTCHAFGQVASTGAAKPVLQVGETRADASQPLASDYSFLLSLARMPPAEEDGGGSALPWVGGAVALGLLAGAGILLARRRNGQAEA